MTLSVTECTWVYRCTSAEVHTDEPLTSKPSASGAETSIKKFIR